MTLRRVSLSVVTAWVPFHPHHCGQRNQWRGKSWLERKTVGCFAHHHPSLVQMRGGGAFLATNTATPPVWHHHLSTHTPPALKCEMDGFCCPPTPSVWIHHPSVFERGCLPPPSFDATTSPSLKTRDGGSCLLPPLPLPRIPMRFNLYVTHPSLAFSATTIFDTHHCSKRKTGTFSHCHQ